MNKREEQRARRRREILGVSLDLFVRRGYAATKVGDIAAAAGMSAGLLFHYFPSKEAVLEELIDLGRQGPAQMMELPQVDPEQFFLRAAEGIFGAIAQNPAVAKVFVLMGRAQYSEEFPPAVRERAQGVDNIRRSAPLVAAGQAMGGFKEGDPLALSLAFWTAVQGAAEELARCPEEPCPEPGWLVDILRR